MARLTKEELEKAIGRASRAFELALMCDRAYVQRAQDADPLLSAFVRDATRGLEELLELRGGKFQLEIPPEHYLEGASAAEMRLALWSISRALGITRRG